MTVNLDLKFNKTGQVLAEIDQSLYFYVLFILSDPGALLNRTGSDSNPVAICVLGVREDCG